MSARRPPGRSNRPRAGSGSSDYDRQTSVSHEQRTRCGPTSLRHTPSASVEKRKSRLSMPSDSDACARRPFPRRDHTPAMIPDEEQQTRQYLLARFWEAALGFWRNGGGRIAWPLTVTVIAIALVNLALQYRLNAWHRGMFDALDKRDGSAVLYQTAIFFPLIAAVVGVAAGATYAKLTLQRRWREWLNAHVLDQWLISGRYYQLNLVPGDHTNPEYRVAEDLRVSVEAPVEFSIGVFSAVISAIVFIGVLWFRSEERRV